MYTLSASLIKRPVLSLQTGQTITVTTGIMIDPANLGIAALRCAEVEDIKQPILLLRDIREIAADCILVNSDASLSEAGDIVRLRSLVQKPFELIKIKVSTESGKKLGHVEDYSINTETSLVQKLYIHPRLIKGIFASSLIIDRAQIVDVNYQNIIVKDTTISLPITAKTSPPIEP